MTDHRLAPGDPAPDFTLPDGFGQTTAEMTAEAKDAISHRGRAFRALTPFIRTLA